MPACVKTLHHMSRNKITENALRFRDTVLWV